ncbi:hypothetical protein N7456_001154 [Penicillium angulare]|uniref:Uncharacterized protein n=1 Tax=Penicillium angulare TaxID=116970 RepID=A0A9W9KT10_9EURO|nr:hypothetical protein N7456_001154 [Penicillium angulare]
MNRSFEDILLKDVQPIAGESCAVQVIEAEVDIPPSNANLFSIYRQASPTQICILIVSTVCAVIAGAAMPLVTVVFGSFANELIIEHDPTSNDVRVHTKHLAVQLIYIAFGSFVTTMVSAWGFNLVGEQITRQLQKKYIDSVLRQNIAFFDVTGAGELTKYIDHDMKSIQVGISQKVADIISGVSGFVIAIVIAFMRNPLFASIMISQPLALLSLVSSMGFWLSATQKKGLAQYVTAENLAQQVLSAMRNVISYGSQERYAKKYFDVLKLPTAFDVRERLIFGLIIAGSYLIMHWTNGLGIWQANRLYHEGLCTLSEALTILYATAVAGGILTQALPSLADITQANGAVSRVFSIIDRPSTLDYEERVGDKFGSIRGEIRFENVTFSYPSRPEKSVLQGVSFNVFPGQTVALIGPSGSGKSTLFNLLERLYPPLGGQIFVDDQPIEELNVSWLRSQIGYVSQDIALFDASIHENVAHGLDEVSREKLDYFATGRLVVHACQVAQLHSFISHLPQGYRTVIGQNGCKLSGGQRQRLAIARAIISQPPILLLDEATAAMDSECEKEVQEAIRSAAIGRTTLIIAHRLSTVRHADTVILMKDGEILEQGSHTELYTSSLLYQGLVKQQTLRPPDPSRYSNANLLSCPATVPKIEGKGSTDIYTVETSDGPALSISGRNSSVRNVWSINKPELPYTILGILFSILAGISYPVQAIFFGNGIISIISPSLSTGGRDSQFWARMYLIHGAAAFLIYFMRGYCFAISASRLNHRARSQLFKSLLYKGLPFFDRENNSVGCLISFLSSGTRKITGISGTSVGLFFESTFMLATGIIVGCVFGWKLGVVIMVTVPFVATSGFLQYYVTQRDQRHTKRDTKPISIAHESFTVIRTITVLGLQQSIKEKFEKESNVDRQSRYWLISATVYGCSSMFRILSIAFVFWYGGTYLVANGEYNIQQFLICFAATIWGSQSAAALFAQAPDIAGARAAAVRLNELMGPARSRFHQHGNNYGSLPAPSPFAEPLTVQKINFQYPDGPSKLALDDVTFAAPVGSFVALVGASGSGKSSVINLIERLYSPKSGNIVLGKHDIEEYDIDSYRGYMALVDQNPCLVGDDLRECLQSTAEETSDDEIMDILNTLGLAGFVMSLPDGLSTPIMANGATLSGGQRQRIAIAKALLRNPKILLLDEATSALDTASEQLAQHALQDGTIDRITVAIAHRIKTIVDADLILVFDRGRIIERGNHDDLMALGGKYYQMARLQDLDEVDYTNIGS